MVEIYRDATRHGQQSQAGPLPASITPVSASQSNCQDLSAYDEGDEYSDIDEGYVFKETIAADQKPLCGPVFSANAAHQPPAAPATKATTDITTDKTSVPTGSESTVTATTEKPTNKPVAQSLYAPYTRTQINELESLFPRLPNPDIAIYMYPHLSTRNEVPVPGYTTVIPLYERVQYALPGEPQAVKK
ncbi:MAG: TIGR03751 family conjugal transfer lipoprotein [Gammaproteobacteria bacterium]